MSVVGLLLIVGSILATREGGESFVGVAVPATVGAALFIAAGPAALPNRTIFSSRLVVYVGLISYPLYLWHWPPLSFLRILDLDQGMTGRLLRIGAVIFAFVAAILTYHLIELPLRHRRDLRKLGVRLVSGLGVAAVAGVVVSYTGGLPQRTSLAYDPFAWAPSMRFEERCAALYGQPEDMRQHAFCIRTDYSRDPTIVMIGDSHSNMFWPALRDAYPGASLLQIGAPACPYVRGTEYWTDATVKWRPMCPVLNDSAYRALEPASRVVILIARLPIYVATPAEFAATFDFLSPGHLQSPDFPGASPTETYERALARDLASLLQQRREVVLMMPVPPLNFSPRSCVRIRPVDRWLPVRAAGVVQCVARERRCRPGARAGRHQARGRHARESRPARGRPHGCTLRRRCLPRDDRRQPDVPRRRSFEYRGHTLRLVAYPAAWPPGPRGIRIGQIGDSNN